MNVPKDLLDAIIVFVDDENTVITLAEMPYKK